VNANNAIPVTGSVMRSQPWPPDTRLFASLPLRGSLELDATGTAPRAARRWIAKLLPEWSLSEFEEVALLVASELVTNAVVATCAVAWTSPSPPVGLWLRGGLGALAVLVWDASLMVPVARETAAEDESGRGLAIVATLSSACGFYYPHQQYGGKVTWAIIGSP